MNRLIIQDAIVFKIDDFLKKMDYELRKSHNPELVKVVIDELGEQLDKDTTKSELISKMTDIESILKSIKTETGDDFLKSIYKTYGEKSVKGIMGSMIPSSLMIAASLFELSMY
jgi:hypothetical protein